MVLALAILLGGAAVGFGFRGTIASALNLDALQVGPGFGGFGRSSPSPSTYCPPPKIWTGNGCADPRTWTHNDHLFFDECLAVAFDNPPPPLPDKAITADEYASCAQQTEKGKNRGAAQSSMGSSKFEAKLDSYLVTLSPSLGISAATTRLLGRWGLIVIANSWASNA